MTGNASNSSSSAVCVVCGAAAATSREAAQVHSNVRRHKDQTFAVWRCASCRSIHGPEISATALAEYYRDYPFHRQKLDLMSMLAYDNLLRRLRAAGVRKTDRILDYGCGSGKFIAFLHWKGYKNATGYDAYSAEYSDPAIISQRYDCVVSQDVIEHVSDPMQLFAELARYCKPGGILVIGTPNAEAIELSHADDFRHTLHQPYHLHILSRSALLKAGEDLGLSLVRYYPRQYSNTLWPGLNQPFCLFYARQFDDTMDLAFDGPRFSWAFLGLRGLLYAFFGYFFSVETDVMAVFRASQAQLASKDDTPKLPARAAALGALILLSLFASGCPRPGEGAKAEAYYKRADPIIAALDRYKTERGTYPEKLSELPAEWLPPVPPDEPSNERAFGYKRFEDHFELRFGYGGPGLNRCTFDSSSHEAKRWQCSGYY